jgi:hypothetical protein
LGLRIDRAQMDLLAVAEMLPLHRCPDARPQDGGLVGLRQVVVSAELDAANDRVQLVERRDDDEGDLTETFILCAPFEDLQAGEARHDDVQNDQVHIGRPQHRKRLRSVLRLRHLVTQSPQAPSEDLALHWVVVDHQDRAGASGLVLPPLAQRAGACSVMHRGVPFAGGSGRALPHLLALQTRDLPARVDSGGFTFDYVSRHAESFWDGGNRKASGAELIQSSPHRAQPAAQAPLCLCAAQPTVHPRHTPERFQPRWVEPRVGGVLPANGDPAHPVRSDLLPW